MDNTSKTELIELTINIKVEECDEYGIIIT